MQIRPIDSPAPSDWVIGVSAYEDDFGAVAAMQAETQEVDQTAGVEQVRDTANELQKLTEDLKAITKIV